MRLHRKQMEIVTSNWNDYHSQVVVAGRRFGKTYTQLAVGLARTFFMRRDLEDDPWVVLACPTSVQATPLLWKPLINRMEGQPYCMKIDRTNRVIITPKGYPNIKITGVNDRDGDGLRGLKIAHCGVDEAQDTPIEAIDYVIRPALADTEHSSLLCTGTPKGWANTLGRLFKRGLPTSEDYTPGWIARQYSSYDNGALKGWRTTLNELKESMSGLLFSQEILAEFINPQGAFYPEFKDYPLESGGNIYSELPPGTAGWLCLDPGAVNPGVTLIRESREGIFYVSHAELLGDGSNALTESQVIGELKRIASGVDLKGIFIDPSRPDLVAALKISFGVKCIPAFNSFAIGIKVCNEMFFQGRLLINQELKSFRERLQSYHRKRKNGQILEEEDTDVITHDLDCLRYTLATLHKKRAKGILGYAIGDELNTREELISQL